MIRATVPGKLMLAGEYTVVDPGGPSLAVAVGRYMTVTVEPGGSRWRVTSPGMALFEAEPAAVPIVGVALDRISGLPGAGLITVESDLGVGPTKPGLGASAALAVGVAGALEVLAGRGRPCLEVALTIHRAAQRGLGSGYDVATCLQGGVTVFDNTLATPRVRALCWPSGLRAVAFFTGQGASTVALLERVACWRSEDPEDLGEHLLPLAEETQELVAAWESEDAERILTAAAQVQEELDAFDRAGEIGIYGGGQMQLLGAIEDAGAVARTSGAGGGDCVWALATREVAIERAIAGARALGFEPLELDFPVSGLRVETL